MSPLLDEHDDDDDDDNESVDGSDRDTCPVCGTPIRSIVVRGPTPAERYAQPCGHRLPTDVDLSGDYEIDPDGGLRWS